MRLTGKIGSVPFEAVILRCAKIGAHDKRKGAVSAIYNERHFVFDLDLLPWRFTDAESEADLRALLTAIGAVLDEQEVTP